MEAVIVILQIWKWSPRRTSALKYFTLYFVFEGSSKVQQVRWWTINRMLRISLYWDWIRRPFESGLSTLAVVLLKAGIVANPTIVRTNS